MPQRSNRILIANATLPVGSLISEVLLKEYGHHFDELICSVHSLERSGDLHLWGASVIQESRVEMWMQEERVNTLVLVPNCVSKDMEKNAEMYIELCKKHKVESLIFLSVLGADEDMELMKQFKRIEEMVKRSGIDDVTVVRHGILQQSLFYFLKEIKWEGKLKLPWKEGQKCAPLNVFDLAHFVSYLCINEERVCGQKEMFKLTGPELVGPRNLVEKFEKAGVRVHYEETDMKRLENYLRDIGFNDIMLLEARTCFELINRGKANFISDDQKKTIGKEPIALEKFFRENKRRFERGGHGGRM